MDTVDWQRIVDQLAQEWPAGKAKFSLERWQRRFLHLPYHVLRDTIERYADEHTTAPTVSALASFLPRGYAPRKGSDGHAHLWAAFPDGAALCDTCGDHAPWCTCAVCVCAHELRPYYADDQLRAGVRWMWCATCSHMVRQHAGAMEATQ